MSYDQETVYLLPRSGSEIAETFDSIASAEPRWRALSEAFDQGGDITFGGQTFTHPEVLQIGWGGPDLRS